MIEGLLSKGMIAVMAIVAVTGMSEARSLDEIIKAGEIRVGVNPNFPPMSSYGKTNQLEGFDIDIGKSIADKLGVKVTYVPTETAQRVPFLVSDKIDISLGALTRTVARSKLIDYTVPLHTEAMASLTTDKVTATKWTDFNDAKYTLANMRGNWSVEFLKEKLPNAKVALVDTIADTVRSVAQGRADVIIENIDFFMGHTKNYPNVKWKVIPDTIFVGQCGIGVSKGNYSLRETLNILLYDLHTSNTVNDTWAKWYGAPMLVPVIPSAYF